MANKKFNYVEEDHNWNGFKTRFRQLMDSNGYNMAETARMLDLSLTSISRYFKDRSPDILTLWRIADRFGVTIDWLIGRTDDTISTLTPKARETAEKYLLATASDRLVIDTILQKYDI